jgi:hypothetical protein
MRKFIIASLLALSQLLCAWPGAAQWQVPDHAVPIGRGPGFTGFKNAPPGTSGLPLISQGAAADPVFGSLPFTQTPSTGAVARTVTAKLNEAISIKDYGAVGDGTADDTTAFANFLTAVQTSTSSRTGYIPKGTYKITSKPATITTGILLFGDGLNQTIILKSYNEGTGTNCFVTLGDNASGTTIRDMAINAASGTTGGCIVKILSSASTAVSGITFQNLWLSTFGTDTWQNGVVIDGSAKTSAPTGARDIHFSNVYLFGATGASLFVNGGIGISWTGGGIFPAGATLGSGSGAIYLNGTATVPNQYININTIAAWGLNLTETTDATIIIPQIGDVAGVSIANAATATKTTVIAHDLTGTIQNNWLTSYLLRLSTHFSFIGAAPTAATCTGFAAGTGSTDMAGRITYTSATTCSINFSTAYTNAPFCTVSPGSAASTSLVTTSTSGLAVTFGTAQTAFFYHCFGL